MYKRQGIDRFAQTKVADLSTGMKQKASLAISLVHDPRVIIFDEPTNGLDVLTAKTCLLYTSSISFCCAMFADRDMLQDTISLLPKSYAGAK